MAAITAQAVKALREKTGLPMMDCKRALEEAAGDDEKAITLLREAGAKTMEKRAGRKTSSGRIAVYTDDGVGAMCFQQVSEIGCCAGLITGELRPLCQICMGDGAAELKRTNPCPGYRTRNHLGSGFRVNSDVDNAEATDLSFLHQSRQPI